MRDMLAQHAIEGVVPDTTPVTHPDHHVVGKEFGGSDYQEAHWPGKRWFCFSHDRAGYWMYATDGSGHWTNVSERAIGATFHEIQVYPGSTRLYCRWFRHGVPLYVKAVA